MDNDSSTSREAVKRKREQSDPRPQKHRRLGGVSSLKTSGKRESGTLTPRASGTAAPDEGFREQVQLLHRIRLLQNSIINTLLPKSGFDAMPEHGMFASGVDRVDAATEVLRCRPREFELDIISALHHIKPELEQMKCIQKLAEVFGSFSHGTRGYLAGIAEEHLESGPIGSEKFMAALKFFIVARDHMLPRSQDYHEDFSVRPTIKSFTTVAMGQISQEYSWQISERKLSDKHLRDNDPAVLVEEIGRSMEERPSVSLLMLGEVARLKTSAYELRRITENIEYAKFLAQPETIDSEGETGMPLHNNPPLADAGISTDNSFQAKSKASEGSVLTEELISSQERKALLSTERSRSYLER